MATPPYSCDACRLDGSVREAKYFCTDCQDYMCENCESYHRKVKVTRLHTVLSGDKMHRKGGTESRNAAGPKQRIRPLNLKVQRQQRMSHCGTTQLPQRMILSGTQQRRKNTLRVKI